MRDAVEMIVRELVADADSVDVREVERDPRTTLIEVRVAEGDVGKVIGRQGRTIKALRSLLHAAGTKGARRYVLDVVE
ncbi:MAG TPA: KH domain-containing protein [Pyrinomonadaceae bacterium]